MENGGILFMELLNELLEGLLLLGGALQLQEHVLHGEVVRYHTAIVREPGLGARVAWEGDTIRFIDALRDPRARAGPLLGEARRHSGQRSQDD